MLVQGIEVRQNGDVSTVVAQVDQHELTFAIHGVEELGDVNSAILATLLYPAMLAGTDLIMPDDLPVSSRLLHNLETLQEIYLQWYPALKRVGIHARGHQVETGRQSAGALFSGGVDAMYSFLCNEAEVDELIFCVGCSDVKQDETERLEPALRLGRSFAAARHKRFIVIDTNFRQCWPEAQFSPYHGQFYAAMPVMLGCRKGILGASYSYTALRPWGSHPMTDELIATEWTTTQHHGLVDRHLKVARVAEEADCLAMLRVCNESAEYNCGKCEKCLRTMLPLQLLGKSSPALPGRVTPAAIRGVRVFTDLKAENWADNLVAAVEAGDRQMIAAVRSLLLRYNRRKAVKSLWSAIRGRL